MFKNKFDVIKAGIPEIKKAIKDNRRNAFLYIIFWITLFFAAIIEYFLIGYLSIMMMLLFLSLLYFGLIIISLLYNYHLTQMIYLKNQFEVK